ncbi:ribose transport system permease protein [Nakamurella panacisegetis]|uniref:Ribose transport system permease protein n=1 Tax=Nakamurella panacisegetis TaxID=1090615 RepID=A0A1H0IXM7_9ACTN|nr:ribose transport system permease protein [Nakamurella panacisegetis]
MTAVDAVSVRRIALTRTVLAVVGALACLVFASASPYFLSVDNLINLLNDLAVVGIVAIPATFLLMAGQVDLTSGATAAFAGLVVALTSPQLGIIVAVLVAVATGAVVGLVNGLLVTVADVSSVAATFGSMSLLRGLAYLVPSGLAIYLPGFRALGNARPFLGLSLPFLIFLGLLILGGALSRSDIGGGCREIGILPAAERMAGRPARRGIVALFVASGLAASLVGLIRTSQLGTGLPTAAIGVEITVLTAVLLGGGRLNGGRGSVIGTSLALLVMTIIDNGLSLSNVTAYAGQVFHAALLIIALVIDRPLRRRRRAAPEDAG